MSLSPEQRPGWLNSALQKTTYERISELDEKRKELIRKKRKRTEAEKDELRDVSGKLEGLLGFRDRQGTEVLENRLRIVRRFQLIEDKEIMVGQRMSLDYERETHTVVVVGFTQNGDVQVRREDGVRFKQASVERAIISVNGLFLTAIKN